MRSWEGYEAPWDVLQHPHATVLTPPLSPPLVQVRREKIISGRVIVRQGKPLPGVYFVRRGRCTIVKDNPGAAASGLGATAAAASDATAAASAHDMSSQQQQTPQPQQQQRERGGAITSVGSSLQFAQKAMEAQVVDASADAKTTRSRNRFLLQQAAKHRVVDLKFQSDVRVAALSASVSLLTHTATHDRLRIATCGPRHWSWARWCRVTPLEATLFLVWGGARMAQTMPLA